jgi:hypothetical protein
VSLNNKISFIFKLAFLIIFSGTSTIASTSLSLENDKDTLKVIPVKEQGWYEKINLRGYAQVRYNRLFETNPDLKCEQCDRSWGEDGGFFFRRIRMIFFGNINPRVYFYIQPDFASNASGNNLHFAQIRDAYFDVALDDKKEFRFRIGQSKIPFGFEPLQSSQNRIALDRADGINSAFPNERDLGVFFYYAPDHIRKRFAYLIRSGLKGSGDYGVVGLGVFNGQVANRPQVGDDLHYVARLTYPFEAANGQIIEPGIQAYTGHFTINKSAKLEAPTRFLDQRVGFTLVKYPQPWGFQAEYNTGVGPRFNPTNSTIESGKLEGGYIQTMYKLDLKGQTFFPFVRAQYYDGGKKAEIDARSYLVKELEIGVEWQPNPNFELVANYTFADRTFEDFAKPVNRQVGSLLRLQAQLNF